VCRITDEEARRLTSGDYGRWSYVPKKDWKRTGRMTTVQQAEDYVEPKQQKTVLVKGPDMAEEEKPEHKKKSKYKKGVKPGVGKHLKGMTKASARKQKTKKD